MTGGEPGAVKADSVFRVEVAATDGGLYEEGRSDRFVEISKDKVEQAAAQAREISQIMLDRLLEASDSVSELKVEFGLSFEGSGGIPFFASAKAGATFAVTVTWNLAEAKAGR